MRTLSVVIATEFAKLRRTATLWVAFVAPVLFCLLALVTILNEYFQVSRFPPRPVPVAVAWDNFLRGYWTMWAMVATPILISVQSASLVAPEHAGSHWKQLYSVPVPRWNFFVSKAVVCAALTAASLLIFSAGVALLGIVRGLLFHVDMTSQIPWGGSARLVAHVFFASLALIVVQTACAFEWRGFLDPARHRTRWTVCRHHDQQPSPVWLVALDHAIR